MLTQAKQDLRLQAKEKIQSLIADREDFYQRQSQLIEKIELSSLFKKSHTILSYFPLDDEFDLSSMIISNPHKRWVLPRPIGKGIMLLFEVYELHDLKEAKFSLKVPPATNPLVQPAEIDLAIIPALGYDTDGYRLGRGGGYYDRLLAKLPASARTLGVIPRELMLSSFQRQDHDKPVEKIIAI
jgi:5-formyltetrahydrofolate cyclo-ligase